MKRSHNNNNPIDPKTKKCAKVDNGSLSNYLISGRNVESNWPCEGRTLTFSYSCDFDEKRDEMDNLSNVIIDALRYGCNKITLDLDCNALKHHRYTVEKNDNDIIVEERIRLKELITEYDKKCFNHSSTQNDQNDIWIEDIQLSSKLSAVSKRIIYQEFVNDGWKFQHLKPSCADGEHRWHEGYNSYNYTHQMQRCTKKQH